MSGVREGGWRLAVVPARGGSRRVPRKNVRCLAGRPALAYALEAALGSGLFDRVVVSTDDPAIAEVARAWGGEVPFLRAPALADDQTPVSAATADALDRLDPHGDCAYVAQLMANCPLRTAADVCASFAQFTRSGAPAQLSVTRFGWLTPWWAMRLGHGGELQPLFPEQATRPSQALPDLVCPTGAVWWARADVLRRERTFHVPARTGWELPWQHAVDIDTEEDWQMAEVLLLLRQQAERGA